MVSGTPAAPAFAAEDVYATPRVVERLEDCWFYHTIDLPGLGTVPGEWDLRGGLDDYLGGVSVRGKRVLEVGTASGFLCFAMEQRGAEVVAFDLAPGKVCDLIPLAAHPDLGGLAEGLAPFYERLRNSYWFCHRALNSSAKVVYGSVYDLPAGIGPVDVSTFGCILLHLRDPFLALANAARFARETVVVTDVLHGLPFEPTLLGGGEPPEPPEVPTFAKRVRRRLKRMLGYDSPPPAVPAPAEMVPCMAFLPDYKDPGVIHRLNSWWFCTPAVIQRFLGVLGFEDTQVRYHTQSFQYQDRTSTIRLYTVVGRRTRPMPRRLDGPFPWY